MVLAGSADLSTGPSSVPRRVLAVHFTGKSGNHRTVAEILTVGGQLRVCAQHRVAVKYLNCSFRVRSGTQQLARGALRNRKPEVIQVSAIAEEYVVFAQQVTVESGADRSVRLLLGCSF